MATALEVTFGNGGLGKTQHVFFFWGGVVGWVSEVRVGFFFGWINKYRSTELNNMNNMQTLKVVSFPSKEARSSK